MKKSSPNNGEDNDGPPPKQASSGGSCGDALKSYISAYLKQVKDVMQSEGYKAFTEIMKEYLEKKIDPVTVVSRVEELFKEHISLLVGFNFLLPTKLKIGFTKDAETLAEKADDLFQEAISFVDKVRIQFKDDQEAYKLFLWILREKSKENIVDAYREMAALLSSHQDLRQEFDRFIPDSVFTSKSFQCQIEHRNGKSATCKSRTAADHQDLRMACDKGGNSSKKYNADRNFSEDVEVKKPAKTLKEQGLTFLKMARQENLAEVNDFNVLNIPHYYGGKANKCKLLNIDDFVSGESDVSKEINVYVAEISPPGPGSSDDESLDKSRKADSKTKEQKHEAEKPRGEKRRRKDYTNQEIMLICEDIRYELDMMLSWVESAAKRVEKLLDSILGGRINLETPINMEDHFTVHNIRCIERLLGQQCLNIVDFLHQNPPLALTRISSQLKQKEEDLTRHQEEFNKVCTEMNAKICRKGCIRRSHVVEIEILLSKVEDIREIVQKEHNVILCTRR